MEVAPSTHLKQARILYVITKPTWGGAQKYVFELAVGARKAGHEVTVACGAQGELTKRLEDAGVPVVSVPGLGRDIAPISDIKALISLTKLITVLQPDIVHGNSSKAGLVAAIAARFARVPRIIFSAHGWAFNESRPVWQKGIFAVFHLITVWLSDSVICVSEAVKRDSSWMPFSAKKMIVIPLGIAPVILESKGSARAKLAPASNAQSALIQSSPVWIGTLAELHPTKGLDVAIAAFTLIAPQFPQTALLLIGEGQDRNRLVELAKNSGFSKRILFCGHIRHAAECLSALDIFLFPSRSEALGFAALEAGNASLPVVASNIGGIPEVIENGVSGLLVPVNDVHGFAHALSSLLSAPELREKLGQTLHEKVLKDFSQGQMLEKTLALYKNPD